MSNTSSLLWVAFSDGAAVVVVVRPKIRDVAFIPCTFWTVSHRTPEKVMILVSEKRIDDYHMPN